MAKDDSSHFESGYRMVLEVVSCVLDTLHIDPFGALILTISMTMTSESYWIKVWSFWMVVLRMTMLQNFRFQAKATYGYAVFI